MIMVNGLHGLAVCVYNQKFSIFACGIQHLPLVTYSFSYKMEIPSVSFSFPYKMSVCVCVCSAPDKKG